MFTGKKIRGLFPGETGMLTYFWPYIVAKTMVTSVFDLFHCLCDQKQFIRQRKIPKEHYRTLHTVLHALVSKLPLNKDIMPVCKSGT